jgi:hypothetical protein
MVMRKIIKNKIILETEISNIEVDDRYYSFDYVVIKNGKRGKKQEYSNDYENGDTPEEFKKYLEEGGALNIIYEEYIQEM